MKNTRGFTLIELLAVIVILAIILVIATPQILGVIEQSKKDSFAASVKMWASAIENDYLISQTSDAAYTMSGDCPTDVVDFSDSNYTSCTYTLSVDTGAPVATLDVAGEGKFNGLYVCDAIKTSATADKNPCS